MTKKVYDSIEDIPKEGEKPEDEVNKEVKKEVKKKPCKKTRKDVITGPPINPVTGRPYPPGPPGSTHG